MCVITVTQHKLSEESECVLVYFDVTTIRPTDNRKVRAGNFMLFIPKGEEINHAVGTEYILSKKNDIINPEEMNVSGNSSEGRGPDSDSGSV